MGLFSSIGKFLFGGQRKGNETKSSVGPWKPIQESLINYTDNTNKLYANSPMFSDLEQTGIDRIISATDANQRSLDGATRQNDDVIAGKYLTPDSNPYLKSIAERISGIAGAKSQAMFGGSGRTGGGLAAYYGNKGVTDSLTELYGDNYARERGFQEAAKGTTRDLAAANLGNAGAIKAVGQEVTNRPFDRNLQHGGILTQIGNMGKEGTTTEYKQTRGLFGDIFNSLINKSFGTDRPVN